MTREEIDAYYNSQPSPFSARPLDVANRSARSDDWLTAAPPANPVDRVRNWMTDSDWYRRLSPEAQHVLSGGADAAEYAPPVFAARSAYDAGAAGAQSHYGQAALAGLGAIPDVGKFAAGAGSLAMAAVPGLRRAEQAGAKVLPEAAQAGSRLIGPGGIEVTIPGAAGDALPDYRIAQRIPTVKGTPANIGATQDLRINTDVMRQDPKYWEKVTNNPLRDIIPEHVASSVDPEERAAAAKHIMTSNLARLYEAQNPAIRERAGLWYPGGNRMAAGYAEQIGVPTRSVAGAFAALSPGTDWFKNVDQARRLIETYGEDPLLTHAMLSQFRDRASSGLAKYADVLDPHIGKRWSELSPEDAAVGAWAHDFATRPREYMNLSPEGFQTGLQLTPKGGVPESTIWQSRDNVTKAINALRSGGDMEVISDAAGKAHKVRNFYNNLIAPSSRWDDYTSDTHNIAGALLRPLGQKDDAVAIGLGGGGPGSGTTGAQGLYGMYADAGRELAQRYGVTPFQVQSPTWEGVRALFPKEAKTATAKQDVGNIWAAYRKGEIGLEDAQNAVFDYANTKMRGDINRMPWGKVP
jgi:hypothetical protein